MPSMNHKETPGGNLPSGVSPYTFLTCGYCRNPQLSEKCVEKCYSASTASVSVASTSASATSASSSTVSSSVTPTRTLTTAVISR